MPGSGPSTIGAVLAVYGLGIYFLSVSLSTNRQAVFLLPNNVLSHAISPAATGTDNAIICGSTSFLWAM
jgi:multisubunit Na+/H+ antiporter MnhG subunit